MRFFGTKPFYLLLAGAMLLPTLGVAQGTNGNITLPNAIYERRALTADVAEYTYKLRVGAGEYEQIGIHRIVKETAPNVPVRARQAVFLAPGDIWNFRAAFLTTAAAQPMPVYLAENGIDVWGIDYRWTFVPVSARYDFMQGWGLEQDARDLGIAIGTARFVRAITGSSSGQIFLLGWSRGGQIGYAYLDAESQIPAALRQVKGFIPVDIYLKTDDSTLASNACERWKNTNDALSTGHFGNETGALVSQIGALALSNPNDPSVILSTLFGINGYTNREAGLLVGEATFGLQGGFPNTSTYHFTGGTFDANFKPTGLLYSTEQNLFGFEAAASPVQPNQELADADAAVCNSPYGPDVAFDDHLKFITVPVFYVGAAGGFGETGLFTTTLLGSTDVTDLVVRKLPAGQEIFDYGHADLFQASDAQQLVWQPILSWLQAH
jgi:hypothetical protein